VRQDQIVAVVVYSLWRVSRCDRNI